MKYNPHELFWPLWDPGIFQCLDRVRRLLTNVRSSPGDPPFLTTRSDRDHPCTPAPAAPSLEARTLLCSAVQQSSP